MSLEENQNIERTLGRLETKLDMTLSGLEKHIALNDDKFKAIDDDIANIKVPMKILSWVSGISAIGFGAVVATVILNILKK